MSNVDNVNLMSLSHLCKDDPKVLAQQLMRWGVIPNEGDYMCPRCGAPLKVYTANDRLDKLQWNCAGTVITGHKKRQKCRTRLGFRNGTFLERSHLSILQILGFVNLWVSNCPLDFVSEQLCISNQIAADWSSFCREVVLDAFIVHKQKLGGIGKTVEIGESKFGKRKYYRGNSVEGQRVFGGYERGTGRSFMVPVDNCLPVIRDWIEPGTTIISDYWRAHDCLSSEGYEHLKVTHSLIFKDPDTGAHTTPVAFSSRAASTMSSSGRKKSHVPSNLAQYMFKKRCTELKLNLTVEFLRLAGSLYNPISPREFPREEDIADDSDAD